MGKFMIATFALMGWAFWEMSGGADFVPEQRVVEQAQADVTEAEAPTIEVTRAATTDLVAISMPVTEPAAAPAVITPDVQNDAEVVLASVTEAIAAVAEEPVIEIAPAPPVDLRYVSGTVVNMRGGPSTNFGVVDKLPRGTLTEVVEVNTDGWARIIVPSTGLEGWMAERFLQR